MRAGWASVAIVLAACAREAPPRVPSPPRPASIGVAAVAPEGALAPPSDDDDAEAPQGRVITLSEAACGPTVVSFDRGSAAIRADMEPVLREEAQGLLGAQDRGLVVEIVAHASTDEALPVSLSQRRAEAVLEALVALGVTRRILRAKGYGAYCAMNGGDASTDRFAYLVLRATSAGPTDAKPGCEAAWKAGIRPDPP